MTVDAAKQEVVAHMLPGIKHLLAPTWVRLGRPPEVPELGEIPDWIQAEEGTVRLHLEGKRLEGEISALGHGRSPDPVLYEARVEGALQETGVVAQPPTAENPYRGEILFEGTWSSEQLGLFQLHQTETNVRG